jgi:hypothetical protein
MIMAKKKTPQRKAPGSGFTTQAELEAFVRFNPQMSGLAQMLSQTRGEAETRARDAIAGGEAISQSARMARADTDQDYKSATASTQARNSTLAAELGKLSPAAESYKAAGLSEASAGLTRLTAAGSRAKQEFSSRSADAVAAGRYGAKAARDQGASDARSIMDKIQGVTAEAGAYQAGRVGELTEAQRKRQADLQKARVQAEQSDRNSRRTANVGRERIDAQKERDAAKDAKDAKPKAPKLQSAEKHYSTRSEIDRAVQKLQELKGAGKDREYGAKFIRSEIPDTKDGQDKIPGRKANDRMTASIALNLVYDGGISGANVKGLHDQRFSLEQLGLADQTRRARGPRPSLKGKRASGSAGVGTR